MPGRYAQTDIGIKVRKPPLAGHVLAFLVVDMNQPSSGELAIQDCSVRQFLSQLSHPWWKRVCRLLKRVGDELIVGNHTRATIYLARCGELERGTTWD